MNLKIKYIVNTFSLKRLLIKLDIIGEQTKSILWCVSSRHTALYLSWKSAWEDGGAAGTHMVKTSTRRH